MQRNWHLQLPNGNSCRWAIKGETRLHEFFQAIVSGAGLEALEQQEKPPDCLVVGLDNEKWNALTLAPVPRLERVLKVDWRKNAANVNYLNLDRLPSAISLMLLRRMLVLHAMMNEWLSGQTVQFHGALFQKGTLGVIIAGRSGTGKSTCARKAQPPWECLCDDCMLITLRSDGYWARPMPTWSAFLTDDQQVRPLKSTKAIRVQKLLYLEQSVIDTFYPVTLWEAVLGTVPAVIDLFQVCNYAMPLEIKLEAKRQGFEFSTKLAQAIPVQRMAHTLDGRPWETLE